MSEDDNIFYNYTLDQVFKDCQSFKLKPDMGLTDVELRMIELAYLSGQQRQLERHITDLEQNSAKKMPHMKYKLDKRMPQQMQLRLRDELSDLVRQAGNAGINIEVETA